jgi:uncharacterized membrane protein YeaQ/YmgE (transglycosylase-associated protein family)
MNKLGSYSLPVRGYPYRSSCSSHHRQLTHIYDAASPRDYFVARRLLYTCTEGSSGGRTAMEFDLAPRFDTIYEEDTVINLILWLLFGALVGWLASIVMRTDGQQGALLNIVVGIIGAMIGGFLFGGPTINSSSFNLTALLISFVGAVILLAIVNLVRRGSVR